MDAVQRQRGIGGVQEGPDVQAGAGVGGHPVLIHPHHLLDGLQCVVGIHLGQAQTLTGTVQPGDVLPGAEELHLAVRAAVRLQPLEHLGAVVQDAGGGGQGNGAVGHDAGVVPAVLLGVVHDKHVVGEHGAEAQLIGGGQGAGMGILGDSDIHGDLPPENNKIQINNMKKRPRRMAEPLAANAFVYLRGQAGGRGRHVPAYNRAGQYQQNNNGRQRNGVHGQNNAVAVRACGHSAGGLRVSGHMGEYVGHHHFHCVLS